MKMFSLFVFALKYRQEIVRKKMLVLRPRYHFPSSLFLVAPAASKYQIQSDILKGQLQGHTAMLAAR